MPLRYGGAIPKVIRYNGAVVKKITYGGKVVWQSEIRMEWNNLSVQQGRDFVIPGTREMPHPPVGATRLVKIITVRETKTVDVAVNPNDCISITSWDPDERFEGDTGSLNIHITDSTNSGNNDYRIMTSFNYASPNGALIFE